MGIRCCSTVSWVAVQAGAHRSWFHLYRMLMLPRPQPDGAPPDDATGAQHAELDEQQKQQQQRAVAVEQFMQSAPLGEYQRRLDLLWAFRWALLLWPITNCLAVLAVCRPSCVQ